MTNEQKSKIIELRKQGLGYGQIAIELSLSKNTVSSFCKRNDKSEKTIINKRNCKCCGKEITSLPKKKDKIFCSNSCRLKWWNEHQDEINKKAFYTLTCKHCGKEFTSYGNKYRKFCSRECYRNYQCKGGGHNE